MGNCFGWDHESGVEMSQFGIPVDKQLCQNNDKDFEHFRVFFCNFPPQRISCLDNFMGSFNSLNRPRPADWRSVHKGATSGMRRKYIHRGLLLERFVFQHSFIAVFYGSY